MAKEYIERVPFEALIEHLNKKEPCKNCYHQAACDAWIRNATTLYDDYTYSVKNCPYYKPTADVVEKEKIAKEIFTKLYAHVKYDGHTVSVWKNDLIYIAKQYGVDLDCGAKMDGG